VPDQPGRDKPGAPVFAATPGHLVVQGVLFLNMPKRRDIGGDGVVHHVVVGRLPVGQVNRVAVAHAGFCQAESRIGTGLIGLNVRRHSVEVAGEVLVGLPLGLVLFVLEVYAHPDRFAHRLEALLVV
jgi:hypothetical protein